MSHAGPGGRCVRGPDKKKNLRPSEHRFLIFVALERAWSNYARFADGASDAGHHATVAMPTPNRRIRMTSALAEEIERRYRAGESSRVVADGLGISKSTVLKTLCARQVERRLLGARY